MQNKAMNCAYLAMIKSIMSCKMTDWGNEQRWMRRLKIEPKVFESVTRWLHLQEKKT